MATGAVGGSGFGSVPTGAAAAAQSVRPGTGFFSRWFGSRSATFERKAFVPVPPEGELM
jgi:hypothetical protein